MTVPEIWPGQDRGGKKKKKKKKKRKNELTESHKASPTGIAKYVLIIADDSPLVPKVLWVIALRQKAVKIECECQVHACNTWTSKFFLCLGLQH